jgi:hypothetical protein
MSKPNLYQAKRKKAFNRNLWWERLMAVILLVNLVLVLFDLSYIARRSFYFFYVRYQDRPVLTDLYDRVKGIEPNRQTQRYLQTADRAIEQLQQTNGAAIGSAETETTLQQLGDLSVNLIDTDPFTNANLSGYLEKIKNRMREHVGYESAKQSFQTFWSRSYLQNRDLNAEIAFYQQEIRPLIAVNYFRSLNEAGVYIDRFWLIDIWFNLLFGLEFVIRTWFLSQRYNLSCFDAMLWRWYDLFLILPFWRFLRVITVIIRLNQAQLISLEGIKKQASKGFVNTIADELTEVVVTHVIDRLQDSIRQGEITDFIVNQSLKPYVDLNNTNETAEITKLIANICVHKILPQIRPDVEAILQYSIEKALKQTPGYQGIQLLPGLGSLQANLTEQIVKRVYQSVADFLTSILEKDQIFEELLEKLIFKLNQSIAQEIQDKQSLAKIESLLVELLQEIKINYVEPISEKKVDAIWQETRIVPK